MHPNFCLPIKVLLLPLLLMISSYGLTVLVKDHKVDRMSLMHSLSPPSRLSEQFSNMYFFLFPTFPCSDNFIGNLFIYHPTPRMWWVRIFQIFLHHPFFLLLFPWTMKITLTKWLWHKSPILHSHGPFKGRLLSLIFVLLWLISIVSIQTIQTFEVSILTSP